MTISELVDLATEIARSKGFGKNDPVTSLALIHSEVSEALEVLRNPNDYSSKEAQLEHFSEELADIVIRVAHLAGEMELGLEGSIIFKCGKNMKRPPMHGGKAF